MDINYFPGRIRLRDRILKDEELREAALAVARKITDFSSYQYNPKTGSVLIEYDESTVPMEKIESLKPLIMKIHPKISFYSERNKPILLEAFEEIGKIVDSWK